MWMPVWQLKLAISQKSWRQSSLNIVKELDCDYCSIMYLNSNDYKPVKRASSRVPAEKEPTDPNQPPKCSAAGN